MFTDLGVLSNKTRDWIDLKTGKLSVTKSNLTRLPEEPGYAGDVYDSLWRAVLRDIRYVVILRRESQLNGSQQKRR